MQGQMHVHATELDPPVPLVGHFFRHIRGLRSPLPPRDPPTSCAETLASFHLCNRTSTARSDLVADFGP
ncbi:hypothetical protein F7R91_30145 [Streptomyces luteolifulvus]|uniref:Uncharacterized protein n=1 Tax=Streptomyces luteolifulvus TaxID=2615112 RepID=A0A6H9UTT5_9ACTN|nr:hypothetical protein F7R91_30145 [Streptomyces luteolifulvus]